MEQKGFDFNFVIGIFLIFGILTWFNSTQLPPEDILESNIESESNISKLNSDVILETKSTSDTDFMMTMDEKDVQSYELSNDLLSVKISNYGASIDEVVLKKYYTHDSLELKMIDDLKFNFSFFLKEKKINTNTLYFNNVMQNENDLAFTYKDNGNNTITFIYTLLPNSYVLNFEILTEDGLSYIEPDQFIWAQKINQFEKHLDTERNSTTINYSVNDKNSKQLSLMKEKEKTVAEPLWVANRQQFFSTIIASKSSFKSVDMKTQNMDDDNHVKLLQSTFSLNYDNQKNQYLFDFYFLPNKYSLLSSFDKGFESLVPLGWGIFGWVNKFLIIPMFNFLENSGLNYGIIILIIALVIKLILFLPTKSSYLSMAKMRVLKPEIDAINEKIEDPVQRQQAHMNLYRKTGVNPLGGCLPLLFQMPILIALFRFFPSSIELRQQKFLWADDLSTYDSILDLGFNIPLYGDHISLFALLMTMATVLQMTYSNQMSPQNSQMPQMKYVMYTMPVIFLLVMNNYSSALSYYYFLANVITFAQQAIIRQGIDDDKLYAMLQENKKKPLKKSKFQQRLEEIAKNQKR